MREGTAALIDMGGMRLWAVSLHLKSGCHFDNDLAARADCRTLAKQLPILEDWLDEKSAAGFQVALLGDFNRRLDRGSDVVRDELDDGDPVDLFKVPHRQELTCSSFSPNPAVSIDYVVVNEALWERVHVPSTPNLDVASSQVSDHCPVFLDIVLSDWREVCGGGRLTASRRLAERDWRKPGIGVGHRCAFEIAKAPIRELFNVQRLPRTTSAPSRRRALRGGSGLRFVLPLRRRNRVVLRRRHASTWLEPRNG